MSILGVPQLHQFLQERPDEVGEGGRDPQCQVCRGEAEHCYGVQEQDHLRVQAKP